MKCNARCRLLAAGGYATAALGAALVSQFFFGLHPCELCVYQRWPYAVIIALALVSAILVRSPGKAMAVLAFCAVLYLLDAGIAVYHTGVEQGVFEGLDTCSAGELPPNASLEDIRKQLMEAPVVSCKDTMFSFLGISMAGWNTLYALGGVALSVLGIAKLRKKAANV